MKNEGEKDILTDETVAPLSGPVETPSTATTLERTRKRSRSLTDVLISK